MTSSDVVHSRLSQSLTLREFWRKVYKLRRLAAGDVSVLRDSGDAAETDAQKLYKEHIGEFEDILVRDIETGRGNRVIQAVRTLAQQVSYKEADIEFRGLPPMLASWQALYCKDRFKKCNAPGHMQLAVLDYLLGGFGWTKSCILSSGYPGIMYVDTLNMVWDLTATFPGDMQWAGMKINQPLYKWVKRFGANKLVDVIDQPDDTPIEMTFYYDICDDEGTHEVWRSCEGIPQGDKPVYRKKTPFRMPEGDKTLPMLPFQAQSYLLLPGQRFPTSPAELMMPSQIALWERDRIVRETIARSAPFYEVEKGALDEKSMKSFLEGEIAAVIERQAGTAPIQQHGGLEISQTSNLWGEMHEKNIVAQSGMDPYASGSKVEGTKFSSEVQAIKGASGLVAGVIAKDHAYMWELATQKMLAIAAQYDDEPVAFHYDGATVKFDKQDPIKNYLQADVEIIVREDAMQYRSRQDQILMAKDQLDTCIKVAQMFPNAPRKAFENYLRASGENNVQEYMEMPTQPNTAGDMAATTA